MQNVNAYKNGYIDFCRQMPPSLKTVMSFRKRIFRSFLQKYCFFQKTCFIIKKNRYLIRDKKGCINFLPQKLPFHKKWSNGAPEQFFAVSSENTASSKKIISYKNIWHLIFDRKGYIHF